MTILIQVTHQFKLLINNTLSNNTSNPQAEYYNQYCQVTTNTENQQNPESLGTEHLRIQFAPLSPQGYRIRSTLNNLILLRTKLFAGLQDYATHQHIFAILFLNTVNTVNLSIQFIFIFSIFKIVLISN